MPALQSSRAFHLVAKLLIVQEFAEDRPDFLRTRRPRHHTGVHEGTQVDAGAFQALVKAAVAANRARTKAPGALKPVPQNTPQRIQAPPPGAKTATPSPRAG